MAFNTQEQEIIKYGVANGKSRQEVEQAISNYRSGVVPKPKVEEVPKETLGSKLATTGKETVNNIKDVASSDSNLASKALQITGDVAGGAVGAVGDVISSTPVVGDAINAVAKPISAGIKATQDWIANNPSVQNAVSNETSNAIASFLDQHPDIAKNAEAVNNIANAILIAKGGIESAGTAKNALVKGASAVADANTGIIDAVKTGTQAIKENPIVAGAADIAKMAGEGISRVPARIATNVAERQANEAAIKSLSSQTAQTAVRDGVDIVDVKDLSAIPRTPEVNKVIRTVKEYASGNKKVDPMEVIGEQTTKRFKELVNQKKEIGAKLGEASKTIGILTKPELQNGVINRIKSVPGLEGVSVTPKGKLNFKGTTLEADLPSAILDRKAIQNAYDQAIKWGDGERAHMYRQTLFEDLGGKKRGGVQLTGTQEKAFNAIRQGLSDVIETKSPSYKKYSNEYRKIIEPIEELQKRVKTLDPNAEDFSDSNLGAGILARRITSTAASNADVRALLKKLDSVGTTKGSSFKNTLDMQDMYNILNKYYDIAPRTGFQNLSKEALSSSPLGMIKETLTDVAGKSNAVRQKALEKLLEEQGIVLK